MLKMDKDEDGMYQYLIKNIRFKTIINLEMVLNTTEDAISSYHQNDCTEIC